MRGGVYRDYIFDIEADGLHVVLDRNGRVISMQTSLEAVMSWIDAAEDEKDRRAKQDAD